MTLQKSSSANYSRILWSGPAESDSRRRRKRVGGKTPPAFADSSPSQGATSTARSHGRRRAGRHTPRIARAAAIHGIAGRRAGDQGAGALEDKPSTSRVAG